MKEVILLYLCTVLSNVNLISGAWSSSDERSIRSTIFNASSYDRLTRPSEITYVGMALNLLTINTLDIKGQQLSVTGWLTVEWTDSRLAWTVTTGAESSYVFGTKTEIWFPEIFVDNSLADVNVIANDDLLYKVKYDGTVDWEVPRIFTTYCQVDITYFPFDTQTCTIEVTSWAYNKEQLRLQHLKTEVNVEDFKQHGEFIYKGSSVSTSELSEHLSDGTVEYFTLLDFNIVLQRRPSYYIISMILPVLFFSYLMTITFVLPADSGEKVGFALTALLAVAVLLTLILAQLPSTALHISLLSIFIVSNLVLNVISVFCTIVVVYLYHRDEDKRVPPFVKSIAEMLAKASCSNGCTNRANTVTVKEIQLDENVFDKTKDRKIPGEKEVTASQREYSWREISSILDWFLFVYTCIFTTVMNIVYIMALSIGGGVHT